MSINLISGWRYTNLGQIVRIRRGASPRPIDSPEWFADQGSGWVRIIDVTRSNGRLRTTEQCLSPRGVAKSVSVKPGQLIMSICATIGEPAIVEIDVCIHDGFVVFDQYEKDLNTQFLYHFLRYWTPNFRGYGQTGTQANLNTDIVGATRLLVPSKPVQQYIAKILDTMDEAIARTEALIAKLKQMKAGLLHDLLTRGLDENGQLRDAIAHPEQFKNSPLGQIPKEWEISTIGNQASTSSGSTPSRSNVRYWQDGIIPWVKTGEVNYTVIQDTEEKITQNALDETSLTLYPVGTVLVAMYGQGVTRGKVGTLGIEATTNQACAAIITKDDVLRPRYLFHYLTYCYDDIRSVGHGSHQSNLNEHLIASYSIRLPSIGEQNRIIEILDTHDTRIRTEEAYRDKLKLQKKGLMQDLLTGKVRVNDAELAKEQTSQLAALTTA